MKKYFYAMLAVSGLLFFTPNQASATPHHVSFTETPTEAQGKNAAREQRAAAREKAAAAREVSKMKKLTVKSHRFGAKVEHAMMVMLGFEDSKTVTSPRQLRRQLHSHQKQLKQHARFMSRVRRARAHE